ncbi:peptidylprolyl isomerase [Marisediminicola senii]|uniref:peptidylprolyl isomerase n=1 Tax=Marisediminicola senii TaxID=2711233 RepID=UPI0013EABD58|nr:peptidylprolyl isomerase [Marisediminicola senii]
MAPSRNADRTAREARERLRRFQARQGVHAHQEKRRRRDNLIAVLAVLVVLAIATVGQVVYFTSGPGTPEPTPSASPSADADDESVDDAAVEENVGDVPAADIAQNRTWSGELVLDDVALGIEIDGAAAPQAASVFVSLVQDGFYVDNACHRLTTADTSRVIQCGQPDGVTTIDPGFSYGPVENAPADGVYPAGTIAVARAESQYSQSTQFFITYGDSQLDTSTGGYSVIGTVTSGLDRFTSEIAAAGVQPGDDGQESTDGQPARPATITAITLQ